MDIRLDEIWEKAKEFLAHELSAISFNSWIAPLKPISTRDGVLFFQAPNRLVKENADTYRKQMEAALIGVIPIKFTVRIETPDTKDSTAPLPPIRPSADSDRLDNNSDFNSNYTFENFVVGDSNRVAYAACTSVVKPNGGPQFNPVFIYGGSGLGKTHLMHAIGNHSQSHAPDKHVLYVTCEYFFNEFIRIAINQRRYDEFRAKYRNCDILLIDDIQFMEGKDQMQIEFFNTFNTLYEAGNSIVITCDKPPQRLYELEERLRTRFASGLIVDIKSPDYETRVAILENLAKQNGTIIGFDVIDYIASNIVSNIRELEGAFSTVLAYGILTGSITLDFAKEALKGIIHPAIKKAASSEMIIEVVARYYNVSLEEMRSSNRSREVAEPRQIAMYLCKTITDDTYVYIGQILGNRDHTTIRHGYQKVKKEIDNANTDLISHIEDIKKRIASR